MAIFYLSTVFLSLALSFLVVGYGSFHGHRGVKPVILIHRRPTYTSDLSINQIRLSFRRFMQSIWMAIRSHRLRILQNVMYPLFNFEISERGAGTGAYD
jgi:hypothetical protein